MTMCQFTCECFVLTHVLVFGCFEWSPPPPSDSDWLILIKFAHPLLFSNVPNATGCARRRRGTNRHSRHCRPRRLCSHTRQLFPKRRRFSLRFLDNGRWKFSSHTGISVSWHFSSSFCLIMLLLALVSLEINRYFVFILTNFQRTNFTRQKRWEHTILVGRQQMWFEW